MTPDFVIGKGALLPVVPGTFTANGAVVDLSAATVRFQMRKTGGGEKVDAAATILSGTDGTVQYAWTGTDTNTPGWYEGVFEATVNSKKLYSPSRPLLILVQENFAE